MDTHIQEYLDSRRMKEGSKNTYKLWLLRLARFCNKGIGEVSIDDLNRFYEIHTQRYSDKSLQLAFNIYHAYFKFWNGEVPCINSERIQVPRARSNSHYTITPEEHLLMMNHLKENNFRELQQKLICSMLYDTGMRVKEMTSLTLDSIEAYQAEIETEKTTKRRVVYWGYVTEQLLIKYIGIRKELGRGKYLFLGLYKQGHYSNRISARSVERIIRRITKGVGIRNKIVPHSYRHSRIQRWFNSGLSPHHIILLSGHESTVSLEHYMRLGVESVKEMAKKYM